MKIFNLRVTMIGLLLSVIMVSSCSVTQHNIEPKKDFVPYVEVFDKSALKLLETDALIQIVSSGNTWTEGPLWVEDGGYLLFSDIPNNVIRKYQPQVGTTEYLTNSGATGLFSGDYDAGSNGLLLNSDGALILFQQGDRRVAMMQSALTAPMARFSTIVGEFNGQRLNSPNDGVFDDAGNLYFTDPPYGLNKIMDDARKELEFQGVFLQRANGTTVLLDRDVSFPNGITLTKDQKKLIVAVSDEEHPHWLIYDVLPDGNVNNKKTFYDASELIGLPGEQGLPDGLAVHSNGVIFATGPGGVWLFSENGKVLAKIRTGQLTSNCTLTTDETTLYVTADDFVMSVALK